MQANESDLASTDSANPAPLPPTLHLGDCLEVLPTLVREPRDRFDLVYVDPPFNAGGHRRAREGEGLRIHGLEAYKDHWGGLDAFLAMLQPRLSAIRDVMAECSSLWLHLDHRSVHDAKVCCDRVFGRASFQGEVIWIPGNGAKRRQGPSVTHQTLLIYSLGKLMPWDPSAKGLREPFAATSLQMHFKHTDAEGRRYRERVLNGKSYRYYADEGRRRGSVWADCPAMSANTPLNSQATGYPTQKPEALLERIINAASQPGQRVLDPMCGSGTTLAVAQRLGRRWVGIDQSPVAHQIASARLRGQLPLGGIA